MDPLRSRIVRLASSMAKGSDSRRKLLALLRDAKAPAKLKGKKLDKEVDRLFYKLGDRIQFNIMDLGKLSKEVKAAYEAGDDMEDAMKKAIAKYRQN